MDGTAYSRSKNIVQLPTDALIPYVSNARTHSDEQVAQIAASIKEFGFTNPVLVDGSNGIIAGHGRVLAARKLGMTEVPTIELSYLTDAQRRAYILADNKLAMNAGWDDDLLRAELGALEGDDFDLSLIGFSDDELAVLLADLNEGLTDPDETPEPPAEPVSKTGDLWTCGKHRVLCGDSTNPHAVDVVMDGLKAQAVFTSPPYAVGLSYDHYDDTIDSLRVLLDGVLPIIDNALISGGFCTLNFGDIVSGKKITGADEVCEYPMATEYWPRCRSLGWFLHTRRIWVKPIGATVCPWTASSSRGSTEWEHLWTWKKPGPDRSRRTSVSQFGVWHYSKFDYETNILAKHPGAFPVYIAEAGLDFYSNQGDVVFEPFGGSGTVVIACERLNRSARVVELSPAYCDVIVQRWQNFTGEQATLDGKTFDEVSDAA